MSSAGIPTRPFGTRVNKKRLSPFVSIVGLGCSSFSTFFWTDEDWKELSSDTAHWNSESLNKDHPRVQEWIRTIIYAIKTAGITLLDTAPWYGHGTSETTLGWAMEELLRDESFKRNDLTINTKVGRYEADPDKQFDFSKAATVASVKRSLERLKCEYIDVLQLHDPEFAPSLEELLNETIPAMLECRNTGWCRTLGMTGYPLQVQHQILQRSLEQHGSVWDQAMTYAHFNLHDTSLTTQPIGQHVSFADYCLLQGIAVLAAAPLSMGLLTQRGPPEWHPASNELKQACKQASAICTGQGVDISTLALCMALADPRIPCTILGMKDVAEVDIVSSVARRFVNVDESLSQPEILKQVLSDDESRAWNLLRDPLNGPFRKGSFKWDGVKEVRTFYENTSLSAKPWQVDDS